MIAPVYLFGVVITVIYAIVAGIWTTPLALTFSYLPYVGYAIFRKRPRLRILRHLLVFALIWFALVVVCTVVLFGGAEFSSSGGPIRAYGVDVSGIGLLVTPVVWLPFIVISGELSLRLLRRQMPSAEELEADPTLRSRLPRAHPVSIAAFVFLILALPGYVLSMALFARFPVHPRPAAPSGPRPRSVLSDANDEGPGIQELEALGCTTVTVHRPEDLETYVRTAGQDANDVEIPEITTVSCVTSNVIRCEELVAVYAQTVATEGPVGAIRRPFVGPLTPRLDTIPNHCDGVYTVEGERLRDLSSSEVRFIMFGPLESGYFRGNEAARPEPSSASLVQLGRSEMQAGDVAGAREHLEASLAIEETREAHTELGLLLMRLGEGTSAVAHHRAALAHTPDESVALRAISTEHLGDAFRQAGEGEEAGETYRRALGHWDGALPELQGPELVEAQVRRGVLLSRLGEVSPSVEAFRAAMQEHPDPVTYITVLAHLVVSPPNLELARSVFLQAQSEELELQWKVYLALWVQTIAARASLEPGPEIDGLLSEFSEGRTWSNRLAAFGAHRLVHTELRAIASSTGERAEADFYEGARRLASGDQEGARQLFEQVIDSRMVDYYELTMAREMLREISAARPAE